MGDMLEYLRRVVALDQGHYFSIHWLSGGGMPGRAFQDYQSAIQFINTLKNKYDVYLAMGAQVTRESNGTAIRTHANTCAARCLYMDIDVPKHYASTKEAGKALKEFCGKLGLPPTVIIKSGSGGLHVYWTLSKLITPKEFKKLASQLSLAARESDLLFDHGPTSDISRLLRVPETLNFKTSPPKQVELVYAGDEIDIEDVCGVLAQFTKPMVTLRVNKPPSPNANLGYGPKDFRRPTIEQVAAHCPFIEETLETGGIGQSQTLWFDAVTIACHCFDSSTTAHRLGDKHATYTHDSTEKKLAECQKYRQDNPNIGPPTCATIQRDGATQCATCPHLVKGTSPVALPFKQQLNGHAILDDLPPGYFRDEHDCICVEEDGNEGDLPKRQIVFPYSVIPDSGYIQNTHPYDLVFTTREGEDEIQKSFSTSITGSTTAFHTAFASEGMPFPRGERAPRIFIMNYIQLLRSKRDTRVNVPPLGWTKQDDEMGFAYDSEFVTPTGKFKCQHPPPNVAEYRVVGNNEQVWRDMAKKVLTPDRPDLQVLAATAFAAPLVKMSGQNGYLIGAWSRASGIGKTTALLLAQTVWGPAILGGYNDTPNFTIDKCASLQHLPVMFDEVKGMQQTANFVKLVFELTGGHEKGRADRKGNMRVQRTWHTIIPYASNTSIVEAAATDTQGTHAGVYRLFEFQAINKPYTGLTTDMAEITVKLRENYGHIGKKYAKKLGENYETFSKELLAFQRKLENDLGIGQAGERFWIAAMATTLYGATLAIRYGYAPFDLVRMHKFMKNEFHRMRKDQQTSISDYTNPDSVYQTISALINENPRHILVTDKAWSQPGKPPKPGPNKYYATIKNDRPGWIDEIGIQISGSPHEIRVRDAFLGKWCKLTNKPKAALLEGFRDMGATKHNARLGAGSRLSQNSELIWLIPITGTPLEDMCEHVLQYGLDP